MDAIRLANQSLLESVADPDRVELSGLKIDLPPDSTEREIDIARESGFIPVILMEDEIA